MSAVQSVGMTICYTCIAVAILSVMIPQKRTRRIMSFVIGLFFLSALVTAVSTQLGQMNLGVSDVAESTLPTYSEQSFDQAVAQQTAERLTAAVHELLLNEGIDAQDVQLTLKISDEGRISVQRAVIYINEKDSTKAVQIKNIVYRNIAKEPEVYVKGKDAQPVAE